MARYRVVPERSRVWIEARSNVHPIRSTTDGLSGFVEFDADTAADGESTPSGRLSLPVARLTSGNRLEDRELHKRIDARRFPTIDGVLTQLSPTGGDNRYRVVGDLSFRGVVRRCEDDMTIAAVDEQTLRLEGQSRFDIRDFGMEPPRILMLKVEPDVAVRVDIIAMKEG